MPKVKISDYSQTAASNTDINSINLAEGMLPSDVNNAIRELMKQLKDFQVGAQGDGATFSSLNLTTTPLAVASGGTGATSFTSGSLLKGSGTSAVTVATAGTDYGKPNTGATWTAVQTFTDPAIIGTILEDVYTISDGAAFEIDPGNGSIQLITLGASRTPKATNFAAGESVTLMVDDGSAYTLTWTDSTFGGSGVVWKTNGGVAPTLNTSGYTVITLWKVSTQVYGARVGDA